MAKRLSRRSLLDLSVRSAAGAGLLSAIPGVARVPALDRWTGGAVLAAGADDVDAIVCIYFFGGVDADDMVSSGRLHPAMSPLQPLLDRGALTVVSDVSERWNGWRHLRASRNAMADRYAPLRFLPNGFATLEWAAQLGGVEPVSGKGAFTFASGLSLVAPGAAIDGTQFENTRLRAAAEAAVVQGVFPRSSIGRQLEDAARLLASREALSMTKQVFLVSAAGLHSGVRSAGLIDARYRDVAQSLEAFHNATTKLGLSGRVMTYTDSDLTVGSRGAKLVLGPALAGPAMTTAISHDSYAGAMAWRFGVDVDSVRGQFPGFSASELTSRT
jgi:hypothetical protein